MNYDTAAQGNVAGQGNAAEDVDVIQIFLADLNETNTNIYIMNQVKILDFFVVNFIALKNEWMKHHIHMSLYLH